MFAPCNYNTAVKSVEMHHESLGEALPGVIFCFNVFAFKELKLLQPNLSLSR